LNFDSNGEVVTVTQNSIDGDQGTIVFWLKPNHAYNASGGYFFVARFSDYTENDFWIDHWVGNFNFEIVYDGSTGGSRYTNRIQEVDLEDYWTQNEWMHITATWDKNASSNTMNIYINTVRPPQSSPGTWSNSWVPPTTTYMGNDGENGNINPADGIIDEVRIYNRVLETSEIEALYKSERAKFNTSQNDKLTDGLVGLWSFNGPDMDGDDAFDRSGQNNHGTLTNGPLPAIGRIGQALEFDGDNDYVNIPDKESLDVTDYFTLSAWLYSYETIDSLNASSSLFYKADAYGSWWQSADNGLMRFGTFGGNIKSTRDSWNANEWYHVVAVHDGSTSYIYVNGTEDNSGTNTDPVTQEIDDLWIGYHSYESGAYFNGKIDEVRIYNRALSAEEVERLYNMGH
jgi:hypothetical protein